MYDTFIYMQKELPTQVFFSLGSNQGDRLSMLVNAVERLKLHSAGSIRVSGIYETEPWGFVAEQRFYNAVAEMWFLLTPREVLDLCIETEATMGRQRSAGGGYSSRPIDIDILFYGNRIIMDEGLIVPHPRLHLRRFVLEPMAELAPDFIHPSFHQPIKELLSSCPDKGEVVFIRPFPWKEDID
jgi:2-amino-4-hydroxy-6-hydroxymethyldihydropteridine diphosphokinase